MGHLWSSSQGRRPLRWPLLYSLVHHGKPKDRGVGRQPSVSAWLGSSPKVWRLSSLPDRPTVLCCISHHMGRTALQPSQEKTQWRPQRVRETPSEAAGAGGLRAEVSPPHPLLPMPPPASLLTAKYTRRQGPKQLRPRHLFRQPELPCLCMAAMAAPASMLVFPTL